MGIGTITDVSVSVPSKDLKVVKNSVKRTDYLANLGTLPKLYAEMANPRHTLYAQKLRERAMNT